MESRSVARCERAAADRASRRSRPGGKVGMQCIPSRRLAKVDRHDPTISKKAQEARPAKYVRVPTEWRRPVPTSISVATTASSHHQRRPATVNTARTSLLLLSWIFSSCSSPAYLPDPGEPDCGGCRRDRCGACSLSRRPGGSGACAEAIPGCCGAGSAAPPRSVESKETSWTTASGEYDGIGAPSGRK